MNLEVRHLKLIKSIAEEGSVTKAGSRLYLTQSALSHQLRDVEQKLGVSLFTRMNKRMVLTPAGERLLASAHTVLDELKRTEEDLRHIALEREGILRISTECYTCYHWLPSLLQIFHHQFPRIDVQIVVEATRNPHQALLDGKIDLALVNSPVRNNKLIYKPLFRDEMVVILSKNHHLNARPFINPEDLLNEHLILYTKPEENYALKQVLSPAGVSPKRVSNVQLTEAIVEMVKAGIGVGILSRWTVSPQLEAGVISALPLTRNGLFRDWSAAMQRHKATPAYLAAFLKLLADNSVLIMKTEKKSGKANKLKLLKAVDCTDSYTRA
ncbi:MAG: LysR family transcriptional regulator [Acidobacteria bacterium]|nr:MAG: LysR family transcriptional regulator [Acidobacteriota bacterium]